MSAAAGRWAAAAGAALLVIAGVTGRADGNFVIGGSVKDAQGNPIPGVKVEIDVNLDDTVSLVPGPDGTYAYTGACEYATIDYCVRFVFPDGRVAEEYCTNGVPCTNFFPVSHNPTNVPRVVQGENQECGPAGASSLVGWLREHGYPLLGGTNGLAALQKLLAEWAKTDPKTGTDDVNLVAAINKLIENSKYKGCLIARFPAHVTFPLKDKSVLDAKSGKFPFLILLQGPGYSHYVVAEKVTNNGGTTSVDVMDPFTGKGSTISFSPAGGKVQGTFGSGDFTGTVQIASIICLEPLAKSPQTATNEPPKKVSYRDVHDETRAPRDMHIRVYDPDSSHYAVTGLPAGWTWLFTSNAAGPSVVSFYDAGSGQPWPSTQAVVLAYTGPLDLGPVRRSAAFGYAGASDWTGLPDPPLDLITVRPPVPDPDVTWTAARASFQNPDPGAPPLCTLSWTFEPPAGPPPAAFLVVDPLRGTEFATTAVAQVTFDTAGTNFQPVACVVPVSAEGLCGAPSPAVAVAGHAPSVAEGSPTNPGAMFAYPRRDAPTGNGAFSNDLAVTVALAALAGTGTLHLVAAQAEPDPPLSPSAGVPAHTLFHLSLLHAPPFAQALVGLPVDPDDPCTRGGPPHVYNLQGGFWVDVTAGYDPATRRVQAILTPALGTFILVGPPDSGDWLEMY
jgi:hypothetical protein